MPSEPEFYRGKCPKGGEDIVTQDRLSFDEAVTKEPFLICPLHDVRVLLGVIPKEERDAAWERVRV